MELTPREKDKLLIFTAALLAERRRARDGKSVAALMSDGRAVLSRADVMDGIAEMIPDIQVEATFPRRHEARDRAPAHRLSAAMSGRRDPRRFSSHPFLPGAAAPQPRQHPCA